jgi:hypothetical protein
VVDLPGSQLNNYDLVVEFSEQAFNDLLSAFFDTIKPIGDILHNISGGVVPPGVPFNLTLSFDVPTDIPLPAGTIDTIDVSMTLGTNGSVGTLRFVARVNVNHTSISGAEVDLVQLDLSNAGLLYTNLDLFGVINSTNGVLTTALNSVGHIPLLPVPVKRSSTAPTDIIAADMRIIDDASGSDLDDSALLLTFGGDSPGNRNGFTQGIVPVGDRGAIGVSFDWICNIVRPQLANGLGIPVSDFDPPCHLNTTVNLPGDHNPQLIGLDLTLVNGAFSVSASVAASDTGWNASATVGGSLLVMIDQGNLIVQSNIADPNINVSLDWWVWLAAAVVGAIIGGIVAGVIGAVVGAIVVPLIVWIASSVINGIIQNIAQQIVNALRQLNLNVNVPAIGVNIIFQDVNIDDVVIGTDVQFIDNAPIRSQGQLTIFDGQRFDLDNGSVGDSSLPGADMAWTGETPQGVLSTLCCNMLARTGGTVFDLTRSQLYRLYYESGVRIPESELGAWYGSDVFVPSDLVYAVETDEGRFAVVQVVGAGVRSAQTLPVAMAVNSSGSSSGAVGGKGSGHAEAARINPGQYSPIMGPTGYIVIRYRTFEKPALPRVSTVGGLVGVSPVFEADSGIVGVDVPVEQATFVPTVATASAGGQPVTMNPGSWIVKRAVKNPRHATIRAVSQGVQAKEHRWYINRSRVEGSKGSVKVGASTVRYEAAGDAITVSHEGDKPVSFEVGLTVVGKDGTEYSARSCIEVGGESVVSSVATASWPVFQSKFLQAFGNIDP